MELELRFIVDLNEVVIRADGFSFGNPQDGSIAVQEAGRTNSVQMELPDSGSEMTERFNDLLIVPLDEPQGSYSPFGPGITRTNVCDHHILLLAHRCFYRHLPMWRFRCFGRNRRSGTVAMYFLKQCGDLGSPVGPHLSITGG